MRGAQVRQVPAEEQEALAELGFEVARVQDAGLPRLTHVATGTHWRVVPGGELEAGLSSDAVDLYLAKGGPPEAVERMQPAKVRLTPFLASEEPVAPEVVLATLPELEDAMMRPAEEFLSRAEAERLLRHWGWELPTEAQWEYLCRAGTDSLFFFGNDASDEAAIEPWVSPDRTSWAGNPWGFKGLFCGEWCRDEYRETLGAAPRSGVFAVRGGAAMLWPWQGTGEWVYCLSAMRQPDCGADAYVAVRPVVDLGEGEGVAVLLAAATAAARHAQLSA